MKAILITHKGLEKISEKEIKGILKVKTAIHDTVVEFQPKKLSDICVLAYRAQSAIRVVLLLHKSKIKNPEDIKLDKTKFGELVSKDKTFRAECRRIGDQGFTSVDIVGKINKAVIGATRAKIDYKNPEICFFAYLNDEDFYFGIDFAGLDLSKRGYKLFTNKESIKGTIGYGLLCFANYDTKDILLDPFVNDGVIAIEAALFATKFPVNYYQKDKFAFRKLKAIKNTERLFAKEDKTAKLKKELRITGLSSFMGDVNAARKNAKLAGVIKQIDITRITVDWLDIKLKKGTVDKIVSSVPVPSKENQKEKEKIYRELFYQAEYVLKKEGSISLLAKSELAKELLVNEAARYGFVLEEELETSSGEQKMWFLKFRRN